MMLGRGGRDGVRILSEATHRRITTPLPRPPARAGSAGTGPTARDHSGARPPALEGLRPYGLDGQSLYIDPERDIYLIVLTNRTHPARQENHEASAMSRARIADALLEAFPG